MKRKKINSDEIELLEQEKFELNDELDSLQNRLEKTKSDDKMTDIQDDIDDKEEEFIEVSERLEKLKKSAKRQRKKMKKVC